MYSTEISSRESSTSHSDDEYVDDVEECEDVDEREPTGSSTRLSGFKKPKVGSGPRYMRSTMTSKSKKGKGSGKGRHFGKLAQLLNMPLDVFFEISSRLEPLDMLQLSRVSKQFRSTFASQSARHIWVAARKNVSRMPDCPQDLSEMQYASLIFEHTCRACGKSRALKVDYSLRVRFCGSCFQVNIKKGSTILRPYRNIPENILTLLPRSLLKSTYTYTGSKEFEPKYNSKSDYYYVPEVDMVVRRWQQLPGDSEALNIFKTRQLAIASEIMTHATVLSDWVQACRSDKNSEDIQRTIDRETSIKEKLVELGYTHEDFPTQWVQQWSQILQQPRELTPRIWKVIRPKLEGLIEQEKARRLEEQRRERLRKRELEFKPFWASLATSLPNGMEKALPAFNDVCELTSVAEMLADNDARTTVTEEKVLVRKDAIIADIVKYQTKIKRELVKNFQAEPTILGREVVTTGSEDAEQDLSILDRASTLFNCGAIWYCKMLLPYPDIFEHEHVKELVTISPYTLRRLQPQPIVKSTAILLLKALGLLEDAPASILAELKGRCMCLCGHPDFSKPMDFCTLTRHLIDEQEWYNNMVKYRINRDEDKGVVLHNDHDLTISDPCVAIRASDDSLPLEQPNKGVAETTDDFGTKYCFPCWQASERHIGLKSVAEVTYHMKGKHLKEASEGDAVPYVELH